MAMFASRVLGALVFDTTTFEDVESDRTATWQALVVVVASSLATGFGVGGFYDRHVSTFVLTSAVALVTWLAWAMLTLQIGTRVLPEPETNADLGELLRTLGFAAAPGLLQVFAVFPYMQVPVVTATTAWMFAAMVVAVRHALDYRSLGRAMAVCGLAAALSFGLAIVLALLFGPAAS